MLSKIASALAFLGVANSKYTAELKSVKGDSYTYSANFATDTCVNMYGVHATMDIKDIDLNAL